MLLVKAQRQQRDQEMLRIKEENAAEMCSSVSQVAALARVFLCRLALSMDSQGDLTTGLFSKCGLDFFDLKLEFQSS